MFLAGTSEEKPNKSTHILNFMPVQTKRRLTQIQLKEDLSSFAMFGEMTQVMESNDPSNLTGVPLYINEFWTSKQRQGNSIHEISYRACFKPQLAAFFINRLSRPGDIVFDPFLGRGTTAIEAALSGRVPWGCDISPLSKALIEGRLEPPTRDEVATRLSEIPSPKVTLPKKLLVFFHASTLNRIEQLKLYFINRGKEMDSVDEWIRMVALNRLTGHSTGFFSVYTLPPNQVVSLKSQRRINEKRGQSPTERNVEQLILKKTKSLLRSIGPGDRERLSALQGKTIIRTADASSLKSFPTEKVTLTVTSPPFLDVVDYKTDNWLRLWFLGIEPESLSISMLKNITEWENKMTAVLKECYRITAKDGWMAFEVGEVRNGKIKLDEHIVQCGANAGWTPFGILVNAQEFTKTSNCWGVSNNAKGTNTNRIVLFQK